jgi:phage FluMu protein Com
MPNGRDLRSKLIRKLLLIVYLPICLIMLFCAIYSTYLTVKTWNCKPFNQTISKSDSTSFPVFAKCNTILDTLSGKLSKYLPEHNVLMVLRTVSLTNTFLTYISAWIATYKLSVLPLLWLTTVSIASFIVTLNVSIIFGPLTGKLTLRNF